jgi:hypothetical protein
VLFSRGQSDENCEPANKAMLDIGNKRTLIYILVLKVLIDTVIYFLMVDSIYITTRVELTETLKADSTNSKGWWLAGLPIIIYRKCKCDIQYFSG